MNKIIVAVIIALASFVFYKLFKYLKYRYNKKLFALDGDEKNEN